jgi:hypothetical protein
VDSLIRHFDCSLDRDLMVVPHRGIAYQSDMSKGRVEYGDAYMIKVQAYEGNAIAKAVIAGRCEMLGRHLYPGHRVLDFGAGTGEFVRTANAEGYAVKGFEVMKQAVARLKEQELYADNPHEFDAVCLWDTIEHMENPHLLLQGIRKGAHLFVSLPMFEDLNTIRLSKHYRPGEHLYYFTCQGFIDYMKLYGFRGVEASRHEIVAGRENIGAFAFVKDLPDYHDHLAAYQEMHSTRYYGSSATELHLKTIAKLVRELKPKSILDYGCGRSDLVAHFWRDGERKLGRYDPAIPTYKTMPIGSWDLVLACDLMEHIPMLSVERVLAEIKVQSAKVIFTISTKLARAKLPDGRNAHVTLLTKSEWLRWIAEVFGSAREIPSEWEHELIVVAGTK